LSAEDRQLWGAQMIAMARDGNLDLAALEQVLAQPPWHPSRSDPSAVTEIPLRFIVCSDDARAELAGPVQVSSLPTLLKLLELPPLRSQAARTIGRACAAAEEAGPQAVAALAAHAWALARGTHALLAAVGQKRLPLRRRARPSLASVSGCCPPRRAIEGRFWRRTRVASGGVLCDRPSSGQLLRYGLLPHISDNWCLLADVGEFTRRGRAVAAGCGLAERGIPPPDT
jgi:hypothetical protein